MKGDLQVAARAAVIEASAGHGDRLKPVKFPTATILLAQELVADHAPRTGPGSTMGGNRSDVATETLTPLKLIVSQLCGIVTGFSK